MNSPLGITFKPSDQLEMEGPRRAGKEGLSQQAIQMLSLRYPRVWGARGITSPQLLEAGATNQSGAALLRALIGAMSGGSMPPMGPSGPMGPPGGPTPLPDINYAPRGTTAGGNTSPDLPRHPGPVGRRFPF